MVGLGFDDEVLVKPSVGQLLPKIADGLLLGRLLRVGIGPHVLHQRVDFQRTSSGSAQPFEKLKFLVLPSVHDLFPQLAENVCGR